MNTGIGKIARLPRKVREALNRRLEDGEPAGPVLDWLNALPETQKILKIHFNSLPVNPQNLSEWRQRGYRAWQCHREACEYVHRMAEESTALQSEAKGRDLTDQLAVVLASELYQQFQTLVDENPNPKARWRKLLAVLEEVKKLRRGDHNSRRLQIEQDRWLLRRSILKSRWQREQDRNDAKDKKIAIEEIKKQVLAPIHAATFSKLYANAYGGGELAEKLANFITGIEFDLPPTDWRPPENEQTPPPVEAAQGKSNQIKPKMAVESMETHSLCSNPTK